MHESDFAGVLLAFLELAQGSRYVLQSVFDRQWAASNRGSIHCSTLKGTIWRKSQSLFFIKRKRIDRISFTQHIDVFPSQDKMRATDSSASLPSAVKNQAIKDAKSVFKKAKKSKFTTVPVLKKPVCIWNNQNYSFDFTHISMPIMIDGKVTKTPIRALLVDKD
ncbi:hypothetical protein P4U84_23740, partial [Brevibacillus agri]|nr:hypothetical protein [Brevibacillus agri]